MWRRLRKLLLGGGPVSLLRWFSVTGAVSIGVFSLVLGVVLSRFLTHNLIQRDAEVSRDFVQSIAETQNVLGYFLLRADGKAREDFIEFFGHVAAMPDVLRANVYLPNGTVLWSSKPELIGRRFDHNDELEDAVAGQIVTSFDPEAQNRSKPEHILFADSRQHFIEYYLPVRDPASGKVVGIIELYKAPRALWESVAAGNRIVWLCALTGGLFLYLSLLGLIVRADKALRRQQSLLIEAEGLAFVGELSAAVAHSIRNPLASIRSTAELAAELSAETGDGPREPHDDIIRQVDRIEGLLRTLLTYSRTPSEPATSTDLAGALRAATERYLPEFRSRGTALTLACDPQLPSVRADPVLLAQALYSILANALEATGAGDKVTVEARGDAARQRVTVSVTDSGRGIDAGQIDQVFKPFFTTKSRGLGLGLALVKRIISRYGGEVDLRSERDRGTCVTLHLPVSNS